MSIFSNPGKALSATANHLVHTVEKGIDHLVHTVLKVGDIVIHDLVKTALNTFKATLAAEFPELTIIVNDALLIKKLVGHIHSLNDVVDALKKVALNTLKSEEKIVLDQLKSAVTNELIKIFPSSTKLVSDVKQIIDTSASIADVEKAVTKLIAGQVAEAVKSDLTAIFPALSHDVETVSTLLAEVNATSSTKVAQLLEDVTAAATLGGKVAASSTLLHELTSFAPNAAQTLKANATGLFTVSSGTTVDITKGSTIDLTGFNIGGGVQMNFVAEKASATFSASQLGGATPMLTHFGKDDVITVQDLAKGILSVKYDAGTGVLQILDSPKIMSMLKLLDNPRPVGSLHFDQGTLGAGAFHISMDAAGHTMITHS